MAVIKITDEDIKKWAYGNDTVEPYMDFTIMISSLGRADFLFSIASDEKCPKQDYFLNCLYFLSGQTVRMDMVKESLDTFNRLFNMAEKSQNPRLKKWTMRSRYLFENPSTYEGQYDLWHSWGYINKDEEEEKGNAL